MNDSPNFIDLQQTCDLKELKSSYRALEQQNQKLREQANMMEKFLVKISHAMNTPLNSILGFSFVLQDGGFGKLNEKLFEPINLIHNSSKRLQSLVTQLLTVSQQMQHSVKEEVVQLTPLLQELFSGYTKKLSTKQLQGVISVQEDLVVKSDVELLLQIFSNLLDNAIKFTNTGRVEFIANAIGEYGVAVSVKDTGPGIPKKHQEKIYECFEQGVDYESKIYNEGAGMGLALVKSGVEQLNGLIRLDSVPGVGSCFTVVLPTNKRIPPDELLIQWETMQDKSTQVINATNMEASPEIHLKTKQLPSGLPEARAAERSEKQNPVILIVDDNKANRMIAKRFLPEDYQVLEAESGRQCLNILTSHTVNLVLLELRIPDISGFDVLKYIQAHPEIDYPPILVISALIESNTISQVLHLGAVDYLKKPFNHAELQARVNTHLHFAERERHLEHKVREHTASLRDAKQRLEGTFQQLLQSEKMASIGQLSAGIAHEINNPVGFICSNLSTLDEYMESILELLGYYARLEELCNEEKNNQLQVLLEKIKIMKEKVDLDFILDDIPELMVDSREGTKRVKTIVKGMKAFAHADEGEIAENDINEAIELTLKVVWNELKYNADVHISLGRLPKVMCNISQLNQVFTNLLVNAAQALDEHGEITIQTQHQGDEVVVEIADTGKGIEAENIKRLFDPFFTTKTVGQGTGLGLYLSYEIIQNHKGSIEVQSEPNKGTKFTIRLPVS